ncbi:hypothetical protein RCL1_003058 [Eukaryota sp. TZLM3-RCL]
MGNLFSKCRLSSGELQEMLSISKFTAKEIRRLHSSFVSLDSDKDHKITHEQLLLLPELLHNPLKHRVLALIPQDEKEKDDKLIDFKQFITTLNVFSPKADRKTKLKAAFEIFDLNDDGVIAADDLEQIIKFIIGNFHDLSDEQIHFLVSKSLKEADTDGNGELDFEEFSRTMESIDLESFLSIKF